MVMMMMTMLWWLHSNLQGRDWLIAKWATQLKEFAVIVMIKMVKRAMIIIIIIITIDNRVDHRIKALFNFFKRRWRLGAHSRKFPHFNLIWAGIVANKCLRKNLTYRNFGTHSIIPHFNLNWTGIVMQIISGSVYLRIERACGVVPEPKD